MRNFDCVLDDGWLPRAWPAALLLVLAFPGLVFAQAGGPIARDGKIRSDRATYGVTAATVPGGGLQLETGFGIFGGQPLVMDWPLALRYGASDELELRLGFTLLRARDNGPDIGFAHVTAGVKWQAVHESRFAFSVIPELEINRGAGNGEFTVPVVVALDVRFDRTFGLTANAGVVYGDPIGSRMLIGLGAKLTEEVLLSVEWTSSIADLNTVRFISSINVWFTVYGSSDFAFDVGIGKSLQHERDAALQLGVACRFR